MPGPRAADVILGGGLAAGLLGKAAFAGGAATAALGLFLHLLIMCAMGAVFWLACRRWPWMLQRPVATGVSYGLVTWAAMNYVVLSLSRAAPPSFVPVVGAPGKVVFLGLDPPPHSPETT